ncbi:hypothetical protein [Nostoc sp. CMAA1605]|uniref:hypothetical protein n=1 Tax=Nostoc sp. CMAA1605 TaxID=2055159 RepID=UPI001F2CE50F|nr:hypothetical protein [Nostoc sp. CMAA1605]MCF4968435.1 hypothetical protein [Nostoc sp. CMAA1605]
MALSQVVKIDVNQTVDQLTKLIKYDAKYIIKVANFTRYTLNRVGTYNNAEKWPLGNIFPNELAIGQFNCYSFSFAVNYQIQEGSGFIQLAASWPFPGISRINVGNIDQSGDSPAKEIWHDIDHSLNKSLFNEEDKSISNDSVIVNAYTKEVKSKNIWFYEIREN